jgi:uncharacterized protein (TIGR02594 family)
MSVSLMSLLGSAREISKAAQGDFNSWSDANAPWMKEAYGQLQLGVKEVAGGGAKRSNRQIDEYLQSCWNSPAKFKTDDSKPWCSAFVNWCLLKKGIKGTGSTWSQSWLKWKGGMHLGKDVAKAPVGSIVVMRRGKPEADEGHVAFLWSSFGGKPLYLGGNQGLGTLKNGPSDRVSICAYDNEVLQCIWPLRSMGPTPQAWSKGRIA